MIVLDIEASGIDTGNCGIWQIGAIDMENLDNFFLEEARIDDQDLVEKGAMIVTGKTEEQMRDKSKQSQKEMIINFLKWAKTCKEKISLGQNIGFDIIFLQNKARRYGLGQEFRNVIGPKAIDLHTVAQMKYYEIHRKYKIKEGGISDLNLKNILKFCGVPDPRIELKGEEIVSEGEPHNALEDCKLEAECFSRLVYGKKLLSEFSHHPLPEYLKK